MQAHSLSCLKRLRSRFATPRAPHRGLGFSWSRAQALRRGLGSGLPVPCKTVKAQIGVRMRRRTLAILSIPAIAACWALTPVQKSEADSFPACQADGAVGQ